MTQIRTDFLRSSVKICVICGFKNSYGIAVPRTEKSSHANSMTEVDNLCRYSLSVQIINICPASSRTYALWPYLRHRVLTVNSTQNGEIK